MQPGVAWAMTMLGGNDCNALFNTNLPQEPVFIDGVYIGVPYGGFSPASVLSEFLTMPTRIGELYGKRIQPDRVPRPMPLSELQVALPPWA